MSQAIHIITDSRCTGYCHPGHPERPERITGILDRLESQSQIAIAWEAPGLVQERQLHRAHTEWHLARLFEPFDFDNDTPAHSEIREHAIRSVGSALKALDLALAGQTAFSVMRPPGHHATRDRAMGFCYLNSIAIAALEALTRGVRKVAVLDFDVHHGNGTEAILLKNANCRFVSVHQFPGYPGTGAYHFDNARNYPVLGHSSRDEYVQNLTLALRDVQEYQPDLLAVSAGFDAYKGDPLGEQALEAEDFHWLGCEIRNLSVPFFSLLEGGYSEELPDLVASYLSGIASD